jgi:hypothetical protein
MRDEPDVDSVDRGGTAFRSGFSAVKTTTQSAISYSVPNQPITLQAELNGSEPLMARYFPHRA